MARTSQAGVLLLRDKTSELFPDASARLNDGWYHRYRKVMQLSDFNFDLHDDNGKVLVLSEIIPEQDKDGLVYLWFSFYRQCKYRAGEFQGQSEGLFWNRFSKSDIEKKAKAYENLAATTRLVIDTILPSTSVTSAEWEEVKKHAKKISIEKLEAERAAGSYVFKAIGLGGNVKDAITGIPDYFAEMWKWLKWVLLIFVAVFVTLGIVMFFRGKKKPEVSQQYMQPQPTVIYGGQAPAPVPAPAPAPAPAVSEASIIEKVMRKLSGKGKESES